MLDPDHLSKMGHSNEILASSISLDQMLSLVDDVIKEKESKDNT